MLFRSVNIFSEKCAFYFHNVRSVNVKDVWLIVMTKREHSILLHGQRLWLLIGMATSSKFQTRVIEGIPRGSIEYSLNRIYF